MTYGPEGTIESQEEMREIPDPFGPVTEEQASEMLRMGIKELSPELRQLIENGTIVSVE